MQIKIPKLSLVVLIGPSGSGKSTFACSHFKPTEILSSDACRGMVSDDENDQTVTNQAFDVLQLIARKRLSLGRLTVIDATNVQPEARKPLVELARLYHCTAGGNCARSPGEALFGAHSQRAERAFGPHVIRNQKSQLRRSLRGLKREGFRHVFVLDSPEEVDASNIERVPLWNDKRDEHGTPSTPSAMSTGALRNWRNSSLGLATWRPASTATITFGATELSFIPKDAGWCSWATSWTVAPESWTQCDWFATWWFMARPCAYQATTT